MTLSEVADLITSPEAEFLMRGNYVNKRGVRGYFVQIKCGNHWCKVSVSNADHHSNRVTVDELDSLHASMLESAVIIPPESLSSAFKSAAASSATVRSYLNSAGVEGIWAAFYYAGNWYMVSVSHVDVPVYATPEELDRLADEFLFQQGSRHGKRRFA